MADVPAPAQREEIRWDLASQPGTVLQVDPDVMKDAAVEYDAMAHRLQDALDKQLEAAKFGSAGRDEVSTAVANASAKTNENFEKVAKDGIEQLKRIAEAFRRNSQAFVDLERNNAARLNGVGE
ncbi:PE family protein [Mycobacterium sp. NPDC050853]|uniref:PE family protein n=1 Tax=Mycobacteriaceae TaxID=1762 RepID=UPI0015DEE59C|nr:PE family protein [Mycobacteroides sp. LB1]